MILRLEMIHQSSFMKEKREFLIKNFKLTKNTTFNNVFCNRIFPYYRFLRIFKNYWIFLDYGFFFGENILKKFVPILRI